MTATPSRTPNASAPAAGRSAFRLRAPLFLGALLGLPVLDGCSSACEENSCNCQEACNHLYLEGECNIVKVGNDSREERIGDCVAECEGALDTPGEVRDDYNPYEYTPANESESVRFTNDAEVALWMECVATTSCELINNGYCAPLP